MREMALLTLREAHGWSELVYAYSALTYQCR